MGLIEDLKTIERDYKKDHPEPNLNRYLPLMGRFGRLGFCTSILLLNACGSVSPSEQPTPASITSAAPLPPTPIPEVNNSAPSNPDSPDINSNGSGILNTTNGETFWNNYTEFKFDEQSALEIFEQLNSLPDRLNEQTFVINGKEFIGRIAARTVGTRLIFMAPLDAPLPSPWEEVRGDTDAGTLIRVRGGIDTAITIIRLVTDSSISPFPTYFFGTEACQSSIKIESDEEAQVDHMQEAICNSFGFAATSRYFGLDYQAYVEHFRNSYTVAKDGSILTTIIFSEDEYQRISTQPTLSFSQH